MMQFDQYIFLLTNELIKKLNSSFTAMIFGLVADWPINQATSIGCSKWLKIFKLRYFTTSWHEITTSADSKKLASVNSKLIRHKNWNLSKMNFSSLKFVAKVSLMSWSGPRVLNRHSRQIQVRIQKTKNFWKYWRAWACSISNFLSKNILKLWDFNPNWHITILVCNFCYESQVYKCMFSINEWGFIVWKNDSLFARSLAKSSIEANFKTFLM